LSKLVHKVFLGKEGPKNLGYLNNFEKNVQSKQSLKMLKKSTDQVTLFESSFIAVAAQENGV
jgi:hypothetical protein